MRGLNRGCEIALTELRLHTDSTGPKGDKRKITKTKVNSRVDRWCLLIGLSITSVLQPGVVRAGVKGL